MSGFGPLLPIHHVRCDAGSLSKFGPLVLDTRLSHLDPFRTFPDRWPAGPVASHVAQS
jgi:hypothetical protein